MKQSAPLRIQVSVARQRLNLKRGRATLRSFPISTSKFGLGAEEGSFKTPTGRFRVAEKIGAGQPTNTAFKSRKPVKVTPAMLRSDDLVMSRIFWLDGLQRKNANSHARFIYIHGTNHEETIGVPASHGCIRMTKADAVELFELVPVGTEVEITAPARPRRTAKKGEKSVARRRRTA